MLLSAICAAVACMLNTNYLVIILKGLPDIC